VTPNKGPLNNTKATDQEREALEIMHEDNDVITKLIEQDPIGDTTHQRNVTNTTTRSGRQIKRPLYLDDYITANSTEVESQRADTTTLFTDTWIHEN
jgi:hypothetical protein